MSSPSSPDKPKDSDNIVVDKYDSEEEPEEKLDEENSDGAEEETNRFQPTFPIVQRSIPTTPKRSFLITDILSEDKSSVEPCSAFRPLRIPPALMSTDRFSSISAAQHCLNFSSLKSHSENEKAGEHKTYDDDDDDDIDEEDDEDDDDKSSGQWNYL